MENILLQKNKLNARAYLDLCKPRVVLLMLITAIVGMFLASPGMVPWTILLFGSLGIGLVASAGAALNHLIDRKLDAVMYRTMHRPLPSGRISVKNALIFSTILTVTGTLILIIFVNTLTAILTLLTMIGYAGVYTLYLKRATSQNIVIGGLAGAMPPLLGWMCVSNQFDPNSLLLVLIIFAWTPPHFWALAIHRHQEYAKADIPMLPVTHGIAHTKLNITLYTVLLLAVSILPYITGMSGLIYLIGAIGLGLGFLYWALKLQFHEKPLVAMKTFRYSIYYLFSLFILLLLDHYLYFD